MKFSLTTPLTKLTGVGEVIGRKLALMGLSTVHDLLHYYPRRYDDFSSVAPIAQLRPGLVSVRARVEHISQRRSFKRRGMTLTEVIVVDETGSLKLTWFNSPFIINTLKEGKEYFFVGELKFASQSFGIIQPNFESVDHPQMAGHIIPVYPETSSISSKLIRQLISQCLDVSATLTDPLPEPVRQRHKLLTRAEAIRIIHRPESQAQLHEARASMAFSEVFCFILTGLILQREIETEPALQITFNQTLAEQFVDSLSFQLTDSQRKVSWQILQDMASTKPMNRLLEGDVGSGKTIIAAFASLMTIRAGYQVAIMVPTEVLATQHLHSFTAILQPWGITPRLLTSSLPKVEKRALRNAVADGSAEIVIGTQALLTTQTHFAELGLVVVDEQHRFGVNQRLALKDKAGRLPHVLTMTATPIPRSLALVVYGDLDISIMRDMPAGRLPIKTQLISEKDRAKIYAHIDEQISSGRQAYIVCPSIDMNDTSGQKAVTTEYERLQKTVFRHRRIGLMHGRLKSEEKTQLMSDFSAGNIDILVATTVIEVGVHVENATIMLIESAERFGLATLHQLRGRVGRSEHQAYCYLIASNDAETSLTRLRAMERTNDGFRLAQIDLEARGAGERFGSRQHGEVDLIFANISDEELIAQVRDAALAFLKTENIVEYPYTLEQVNRLKAVTSLD